MRMIAWVTDTYGKWTSPSVDDGCAPAQWESPLSLTAFRQPLPLGPDPLGEKTAPGCQIATVWRGCMSYTEKHMSVFVRLYLCLFPCVCLTYLYYDFQNFRRKTTHFWKKSHPGHRGEGVHLP